MTVCSPMKVDAIQVVVVDAVEDFGDALAAVLRLRGCIVRTACTAEDALALIEQYQPHCVLFDVVMQGMGGDELRGKIKLEISEQHK